MQVHIALRGEERRECIPHDGLTREEVLAWNLEWEVVWDEEDSPSRSQLPCRS